MTERTASWETAVSEIERAMFEHAYQAEQCREHGYTRQHRIDANDHSRCVAQLRQALSQLVGGSTANETVRAAWDRAEARVRGL